MKLCEVFRTGNHTDSKGNKKDWTKEDLDKIVYQFENVHKDAPICVGHPKSSTPAYGWVDKVKRIGEKLYVSFKDVLPEFKEACEKGMFKNRSIKPTAETEETQTETETPTTTTTAQKTLAYVLGQVEESVSSDASLWVNINIQPLVV